MIQASTKTADKDALAMLILERTQRIKADLVTTPLIETILSCEMQDSPMQKKVSILPSLAAQVLRYIQLGDVRRAAKYYIMLRTIYQSACEYISAR